MRTSLLLLLCLTTIAWTNPKQDTQVEIRVQLSTETTLKPVYLANFSTDNQGISQQYVNQLQSILSFDLSNNGFCYLAANQKEKEEILKHPNKQVSFSTEYWKKSAIQHVIAVSVQGKKLLIQLYSPATQSLKSLQEITLTGDLTKDRKSIHKASDAITKSFFGKEGIASHRILYALNKSKNAGAWTSEIWECDWDGGNKRQITKEGSYSVTPVMIPSGPAQASDKFLYVSYKVGQPKIYLASLQKGEGKRIINLRGNQLLPAISPQRDKIAFICDAAGRADLFLQQFDPAKGAIGKPTQLFSYPKSVQASPSFSPDGEKLAFVSDKDGSPRIYLIPSNTDGKRASSQLITKANRENSCPSWSPDGNKLAYSAKTNGVRQIWIYDFASQTESQLTTGLGNKENPAWAPDSLHLVFNSVEGSISDLYIVNLHQAEPIKITNGEGKNHYPSWAIK